MVMHTEGVPNPDAMKFVLENGILVDKPYEYTDWSQAETSPLAKKLLLLRYVKRVLMYHNYITISKDPAESKDWYAIIPEIRMIIAQHLEDNEPILYLGAPEIKHETDKEMLVPMIQQILDREVRPAAQEDGGDIVFESFENGVLNLRMHGSCQGCPYVLETLKRGVEPLMAHYLPEVKKVVAHGNNVFE